MFILDSAYTDIENITIVDTAGGTYWVGRAAVSALPKHIEGNHPTYLKSAARAGCIAAQLVLGSKNEQACPLIRLLFAEALKREVSLPQLAHELGVTIGYVMQLWTGRRQADMISNEFADGAAKVLGIPRLVVLAMAGRLKQIDFFELGREGEVFASSIEGAASRAIGEASRVVADAEARVIAEEQKVHAARKLTAEEAKRLLAEEVTWAAAQFDENTVHSTGMRLKSLERQLRKIAYPAAKLSATGVARLKVAGKQQAPGKTKTPKYTCVA